MAGPDRAGRPLDGVDGRQPVRRRGPTTTCSPAARPWTPGTGTLGSASAPVVDLGGTARPSGAGYDVGAYELSQGDPPPPPPATPTANADAYAVAHDHTLTVPAAGVLTNDTSPAGHALTAVRVSGPSHGTLTLGANGSFTYMPAAGYSGPDSFTYTANDGALATPRRPFP